jgi:hypothetical protein
MLPFDSYHPTRRVRRLSKFGIQSGYSVAPSERDESAAGKYL